MTKTGRLARKITRWEMRKGDGREVLGIMSLEYPKVPPLILKVVVRKRMYRNSRSRVLGFARENGGLRKIEVAEDEP
jgi:hypothetical protein